MADMHRLTWKRMLIVAVPLVFIGMMYVSDSLLIGIGKSIVVDDPPSRADAIVVLHTDVEYVPRLIEAADLYRQGFAEKIVINGNRKMDIIRAIEEKGFMPCCSWDEDSLRVLELFGVPRESVVSLSLEDPYDTFSEATAVAEAILKMNIRRILIVTSKTHTRRARYIWNRLYGNALSASMVSAKEDPFNPEAWWKEGRQAKWVLSEYGAWLYVFWKKLPLF